MECQIMFSRSPAGPCVPWTLVYYDFCSMFPRSGLASQYPTLHRAVCAFRSPSAQGLKCGGCKVITAPNCTHFQPLGLGKVVEFFGSFSPGLKVPVGLGFSPTILTALPIRFPPLCLLGIFLDSNI
jgi:hypothetical protein